MAVKNGAAYSFKLRFSFMFFRYNLQQNELSVADAKLI